MAATVEPCRAGFDYCDDMRAEETRKHPRTARVRECRHMPIPPERPERLQGPHVGDICTYSSNRGVEVVEVLERSYVWAPGDPSYNGGVRRYDWKVVRFVNVPRTMCVDDRNLTLCDA
jgi:hypothetical protein